MKPLLKRISPLIFLLLCKTSLTGQSLWFVHFAGKDTTGVHASQLFTSEAIKRREKNDLHSLHFTDYPVNETWVQAVAAIADSLRYRLRWFNAVTVRATPEQINEIQALPFVASAEPFEPLQCNLSETDLSGDDTLSKTELMLWQLQRQMMNLDSLSAHGLTGLGVRVAIFDAGFKEVDTHPAFAHLWQEKRIAHCRDFYKWKRDPFTHSYHGTAVLGCIGGKWEGKPIGAATEATFFLARTEQILSERPVEEDHWLAAMEWADSLGADIISSSLGYTDSRYTYADLNGRQTKVTQAAALAVRKGILVINSQGNEGASKFHWLGAPADADSVLSVGGSYPHVRFPITFTSYGPNARDVLKPEIAAPGLVLSASKKGTLGRHSGTSFSCPLITGFAACVAQLHPQQKCMELREMIIQSGHLWPYYDYRLGHGVADANKLFHPADSIVPTLEVKIKDDTAYVQLDTLAGTSASLNPKEREPFFYHLADANGHLIEYNSVMVPKGTNTIKIPYNMNRASVMRLRLRIWYRGFLWD